MAKYGTSFRALHSKAKLSAFLIRSHSATTWTRFYPILTTNAPRLGNCEHFANMTKRGLSTDLSPLVRIVIK